jgi:hypothetical protein
LNSRPTVYEPSGNKSDSATISLDEARSRAYEALTELAAGRTDLAGAILRALVISGNAAAVDALADAARGIWRTAIVLLAENGAEAARQEPELSTRVR